MKLHLNFIQIQDTWYDKWLKNPKKVSLSITPVFFQKKKGLWSPWRNRLLCKPFWHIKSYCPVCKRKIATDQERRVEWRVKVILVFTWPQLSQLRGRRLKDVSLYHLQDQNSWLWLNKVREKEKLDRQVQQGYVCETRCVCCMRVCVLSSQTQALRAFQSLLTGE